MIAFVTYRDAGKFAADVPQEDELLNQYLIQHNAHFEWVVWDDAAVQWEKYERIVIKSPWDYFEKEAAWYAWLKRVQHLPVLNPVEVLKWNSNKRYLQQIADAGHAIVPTYWIEQEEEINWTQLFTVFTTDKLVIKPCVSGGAMHTYVVKKQDTDLQKTVVALAKTIPLMAQPFVAEIPEKGEWSLVFFNEKLSHTILKTAKKGEFRVQHFFGGSIHSIHASLPTQQAATAIVQQFAQNCLYARVDGVEINGKFHLVELELIEPLLFMFTDPNAFDSYYAALKQRMSL